LYNTDFITSLSKEDNTAIAEGLTAEKFKFFQEFCKKLKYLEQQLSDIPSETKICFPKKQRASPLAIESAHANFTFSYCYKLHNLINAVEFALTTRNLVTAVCVVRSMLEISCCQLYFYEKIEKEIRGLKQFSVLSSEHIVSALVKVQTLLSQSHGGSSIDWNEFYNKGFNIKTEHQLHINDALRMTEKLTKKPIGRHYSLLSEMTHPNFGSNTLVIETKGRENDDLVEIVLGSGTSTESLVWFFDVLAGALSDTVEISLMAVVNSNEQSLAFQRFTDAVENNKS